VQDCEVTCVNCDVQDCEVTCVNCDVQDCEVTCVNCKVTSTVVKQHRTTLFGLLA